MNNNKNEKLPPDRSFLKTEMRNKRTIGLHKFSIKDCVSVINDENDSILSAIKKVENNLTEFIETVDNRFQKGGRLIYIGAGTSGRLGVLDASEIPPTFNEKHGRIIGIIAGGDSALRISSEGKEDDPHGAKPDLDLLSLSDSDTILGIAAGGTTPYVLGALSYAKGIRPSLFTALLVCTPIPIPPDVDSLIVVETGPEILTGSTRMKAGTATKLVLNTISTTLMIRSGKVFENLMIDVRATNNKLRDRATRIIESLTGLSRNQSFELLKSANGNTKVAIIMHHFCISRENAESMLAANGNRLDRILE